MAIKFAKSGRLLLNAIQQFRWPTRTDPTRFHRTSWGRRLNAMPTQLDIAQLCEHFDQLLDRNRKRAEMTCNSAPQSLRSYRLVGGFWTEIKCEQSKREERETLEAKLAAEAKTKIEMTEIMKELCPAYLELPQNQCVQVRQIVAERSELGALMARYTWGLAETIHRGPHAIQKLREALAAISIENCGTDYRDTLCSLADLFVRAEEVGIDPRPHFLAIAERSGTDRTRGGLDSVAKTLREFEEMAVLRERRAMSKPYWSMTSWP